MKFFVDYENVNSLGFRGAEFLLPDDDVVLFYSDKCDKLERATLKKLYDSGCALGLCRLEHAGHNALDFYITSHIGEVLGRGYAGVVAIVSHDKGFDAVYDYWKVRNPEMKIVCKPDIAGCIISSNEDSLRRKRLCEEKQPVEIKEAFAVFERRDRLFKALAESLRGRLPGPELRGLAESLMKIRPCRQSYLDLMRTYGTADGQAVYRVLKNENGPEPGTAERRA